MAVTNGALTSYQEPRTRLRTRTVADRRPQSLSEVIDLRKLWAMFRRRIRLFLAVALTLFLVAVVVTFTMQPKYSARSQVMFDPRPERVLKTDSVVPNMATTDEAAVDTEVEVLKSREMALRVVQALRLEQDPIFNHRLVEPGLIDSLKARFTGAQVGVVLPDTPRRLKQAQEASAATLQRMVNIKRSGMTYIVDVYVSTPDRLKSSRIANAYAREYVDRQREIKLGATKNANAWLVQRLAELEPELATKEAAVARYRQANNLLSASGATLTEQEISNYNQRLADAQTELATERARLNTARGQMARGSLGDDVGEALGSPVIQGLRAQRATASAKVADLSERYGDRHPDMVRARGELADIDTQIRGEIQRVISNLEAKVEVAGGRASAIAGTLSSARGALAGNNAASVELNRLERDAQVARADYESLLQRYRETSTQAGIQEPDAAVATTARTPVKPSSPNIPLNLTLGLALALAAGAVAVGVAESVDEGLTTGEDIEKRLGVPALGSVPLLSSVAPRRDRRLTPGDYLLAKPLSVFTESFRALRTSLLYDRPAGHGHTIAVTSALPGEGKTTVSLCLARSAAQSGLSVVVVDCDVRRRSLNRSLNLTPQVGLVEVLHGDVSLDEALIPDNGGAMVLPVAGELTGEDLFTRPDLDRLLRTLSDRFDVVVLDTPPVLALADTRILTAKADSVLFITRWRKTSAKAAGAALGILSQSGVEVEGVALNQVDANEQARYGYGDTGHYYAEVRRYYAN